jgi:hypothetical protein
MRQKRRHRPRPTPKGVNFPERSSVIFDNTLRGFLRRRDQYPIPAVCSEVGADGGEECVAGGDFAAGQDFGVDAHVDVAEMAAEGGGDGEVAFGGGGVDFGCGTPGDRRDDAQSRRSQRNLGADPVVLAPRRCPVEIDIGAKADRVDRRVHRPLERGDAGLVDQRDILAARRTRPAPCISKGVPWRFDDAKWPVNRGPEKVRVEFGDPAASLGLGEPRR